MMILNLKKKPVYCVIVGHSKNKQGASNKASGLTEFVFNLELANKVLTLCDEGEFYEEASKKCYKIKDLIEVKKVLRDKYLSALPKKINKLNPKASVSLHCNSASVKASGTEVLFKEDCKEAKKFASTLLNNVVDILQLRNRGVKPLDDEDRGGFLVYNTDSPCIILEPFFINNDFDLERGLDCFKELAEAIVLSLLNNEGLEGVLV